MKNLINFKEGYYFIVKCLRIHEEMNYSEVYIDDGLYIDNFDTVPCLLIHNT